MSKARQASFREPNRLAKLLELTLEDQIIKGRRTIVIDESTVFTREDWNKLVEHVRSKDSLK